MAKQRIKAVPSPDRKTVDPSFETSASELSLTTDTQQIAALAFALWEARGCPEGSPETDWFEAEQQLLGQRRTGAREAISDPLLTRGAGA